MSWGDQTFGAGVFKIGKPQPWTLQALCAQIGGDLWFPEKGEGAQAAKRICAGCPVRAEALGGTGECLDHALDTGERYGVWGGYSERDRRKLSRGQKVDGPAPLDPLKCGTAAQYRQHHRRGETPCEACRRANSLDFNERRRRRAA